MTAALRVGAVLLLCAGCDRVFGLEAPRDDAGGDGQPREKVTGHLIDDRFLNAQDGSPVLSRAPATTVSLQVRFENGERQPLEVSLDDGSFSFERPVGAPYQLGFSTVTRTFEYHYATPTIDIDVHTIGRSEPTPVTQPTILELPPLLPGELGGLHSTGVWTYALFPGTSIDWRNTNPRGLAEGSLGDVLYWMPLATPPGGGYLRVQRSLRMTDVDLIDGGAFQLSNRPLSPLVQNRCVSLRVEQLAGAQRLAAATGTEADSGNWYVFALPMPAPRQPLGVAWLAHDGVMTVQDEQVDVTYGNPVTGAREAAMSAVTSLGVRRHPMGTTVATPGIMQVYALLSEDHACGAPVVLSPSVAIPVRTYVAGNALTVDAQKVRVSGEDVEIKWELDGNGTADRYLVRIFELALEMNNVTELRSVRDVVTSQTSLRLDAALLIPDRYYVILTRASVGYPATAEGRPDETAYPYQLAETWSSSFQVVR